MTINIANAPCSWGVDYADDINNPDWKNVFKQITKKNKFEKRYLWCDDRDISGMGSYILP